MTEPDQSERVAQLEARIDALKAKDAPKPHQETHYSQAHLAWRMVIELVVGLLIGFGMGYGLDSLFGTTPDLPRDFYIAGPCCGHQDDDAQRTGNPAEDSDDTRRGC